MEMKIESLRKEILSDIEFIKNKWYSKEKFKKSSYYLSELIEKTNSKLLVEYIIKNIDFTKKIDEDGIIVNIVKKIIEENLIKFKKKKNKIIETLSYRIEEGYFEIIIDIKRKTLKTDILKELKIKKTDKIYILDKKSKNKIESSDILESNVIIIIEKRNNDIYDIVDIIENISDDPELKKIFRYNFLITLGKYIDNEEYRREGIDISNDIFSLFIEEIMEKNSRLEIEFIHIIVKEIIEYIKYEKKLIKKIESSKYSITEYIDSVVIVLSPNKKNRIHINDFDEIWRELKKNIEDDIKIEKFFVKIPRYNDFEYDGENWVEIYNYLLKEGFSRSNNIRSMTKIIIEKKTA